VLFKHETRAPSHLTRGIFYPTLSILSLGKYVRAASIG